MEVGVEDLLERRLPIGVKEVTPSHRRVVRRSAAAIVRATESSS